MRRTGPERRPSAAVGTVLVAVMWQILLAADFPWTLAEFLDGYATLTDP
jgi:hypothetical protein